MGRYPQRPAGDAPDSPWQTQSAREVYSNRWLTVTEFQVTRPDGTPGIYGVPDPGDNVTIAAIDEQRRVLLISDFSYTIQRWITALPGGAIEPGEDPLVAAKRELEEEGGVTANHWELLGSFWLSPGISPQTSFCFLARDLTMVPPHPESTEIITREWTPLTDALDHTRDGTIRHATAVMSLRLAIEHL